MEADRRRATPLQATSLPTRVVATYPSYPEAEAAVDYLSDRDFPVEHVRIVARGISFVEQVTGRVEGRDAALRGLVSGALVGALFGWIFGLFDWINPLISALLLALYGFIFGAVVGALFGWLSHRASGGRRDFGSVAGFQADHYDLMVTDEHAEAAEAVLRDFKPDRAPSL
jgi:hypothetical protein